MSKAAAVIGASRLACHKSATTPAPIAWNAQPPRTEAVRTFRSFTVKIALEKKRVFNSHRAISVVESVPVVAT